MSTRLTHAIFVFPFTPKEKNITVVSLTYNNREKNPDRSHLMPGNIHLEEGPESNIQTRGEEA